MKCTARTVEQAQLIKRLRNWNKRESMLLAAIQEAVGPNTFRAFRNLPEPPSEVFRNWAKNWLMGSEGFKNLSELKSIEEYDEWLDRGVVKLRRQWRNRMGTNLNIGPAYKLANLLLKRTSRELPSKQKAKVLKWLHVPLDRYTLKAIRAVVLLPAGREIVANATMGNVVYIRDYRCIQQTIRQLAKCAKVPPIALDYIAFNAR